MYLLIQSFLYYIKFIPFCDNNIIYFLIVYYLFAIWLFIIIGLFIYFLFFQVRKLDKGINAVLITFVGKTLFLYKTILLIPILECFASFYIHKSVSSINRIAYSIHSFFGAISLLVFILLLIMATKLLYERISIKHNANSKLTSKGDIALFVIILITIFIFKLIKVIPYIDAQCWIIPCFLFFSSFYLVFTFITLRPYHNTLIMKMSISLLEIYFWCNCVLVLGRITLKIQFNGGIALFLIGIPLIFICNLINRTNPLLTQYQLCNGNEEKTCRFLIEFVDSLTEIEFQRNLYNIFEYVSFQENLCVDKHCPLKKYLKLALISTNEAELVNKSQSQFGVQGLRQGRQVHVQGQGGINCKEDIEQNMKDPRSSYDNANNYYLLLHLNQLYSQAIDKYPYSIDIKISYVIFLLNKLNKRDKAFHLLTQLQTYSISFENRFIIYRLFKYYNESISYHSIKETESSKLLSLSYQYHYNQLKHYILKVSQLYLSFWGLLLERSVSICNDIGMLSHYTDQINVRLEEVKASYQILDKLKQNDTKVLQLYSTFLKKVANDHKQSKRISKLIIQSDDEPHLNAASMTMNGFQGSDSYYIIASGGKRIFGSMVNISLGICSLFGYSYQDIIGKHINVLIPDFMHAKHNESMHQVLKRHIKDLLIKEEDKQCNRNKEPKEVNTFGKTQSKYIIPIKIKVLIIPNEKDHYNFFANFIPMISNGTGNSSISKCTVLTNDKLFIHSFTANALKLLQLNINDIKSQSASSSSSSSIDITECIKQFKEDFLCSYSDNTTAVSKLQVKKQMLQKKYLNKVSKVKWRLPLSNNEANFLLSVSNISINNEVLGYKFMFTMRDNGEYDDTVLYTLTPNNNSILKQLPQQTFTDCIGEDNNDYTPVNNCKIAFDINDLCYLIDQKPKESIEEYLKCNVNDQEGNELSNVDSISASFSDCNEDEMDDDDDDDEDNDNDNNTDSNPIKETIITKAHKDYTSSPSLNESQYYQVSMNKIQYLVYNYKKQALIEISNYQKISQVEINKLNSKHNNIRDQSIQENQTTTPNEMLLSTPSYTSKGLTDEVTTLDEKIETSMNKLNDKISFVKLHLISFLMILLLVITSLIYSILLLSWLDINKTYYIVITSAITLLTSVFTTNYFIFEYALLQDPNYNNFYQSKDIYLEHITLELLFSYNESLVFTSQFLSSNIPLTTQRYDNIFNTMFNISLLHSTDAKYKYEMSLIPMLQDTNMALYNFVTLKNTSLIDFDNPDFLFVITNADNCTSEGLRRMIYEIIEEEKERNGHMRTIIIIGEILFVVFIGFAFERLIMVYNVIEKRKDFYLKLFFNIKNSYISELIRHCSNFIVNIITQQGNGDNLELEDGESIRASHGTNTTIGKANDKCNAKGLKTPNKTRSKKGIDTTNTNDYWSNMGKRNWMIICYSIYFILMFSFLLAYSILFIHFLNKKVKETNFLSIVGEYEIYYLQMFNFIRNYALLLQLQSPFLFYVKHMSKVALANVYPTKEKFWDTFSLYQTEGVISSYSLDLLSSTFYGSQCEMFDDYIIDLNLDSAEFNCETFADNITSYGLDLILTHYTHGLRKMLRSIEDMERQMALTGKYNYLDVMNSDNGRDLCFMWEYLLILAFDNWRRSDMEHILEGYGTFYWITIVFFVVIEGAIVCLYLLYIRPKHKGLMSELRKNKNMVAMIPKKVLYQLLVNINK